MSPRLLEWDAHYATPAEQRLAAEENLRSGIPLLVHAGEQYLAHERPNEVSSVYA
jgi:hypothetical protein